MSNKLKKLKNIFPKRTKNISEELDSAASSELHSALKNQESAIKHYKQLIHSKNKGKRKFKNKDLETSRQQYAVMAQMSVDLENMLKNLSQKNRDKFQERVAAIKKARTGVLAHDDYEKGLPQEFVDIKQRTYQRYEYRDGDLLKQEIDEISRYIDKISNLLKDYQQVQENQPDLFKKESQVDRVALVNKRSAAERLLERLEASQIEFIKAKKLESNIEFLKQRLQPAAISNNILSDKYLETHKANLLKKLNQLEKPSKIYDGNNQAAGLASLQKEIDQIEKDFDLAQHFYAKAKEFYNKANRLLKRLALDKSEFHEQLHSDIQATFSTFMKKNIDNKLIALMSPNKFLMPDEMFNFEKLNEELDQLEKKADNCRGIFQKYSAQLNELDESLKIIESDLNKSKKAVISTYSTGLYEAYERLQDDYSKNKADQIDGMTKSALLQASDSAHIDEDAMPVDWIAMYLTDKMKKGISAFEVAVSVVKEFNRYEDIILKHTDEHPNSAKLYKSMLAKKKQEIVSILIHRPMSENAADEIKKILKEFEDVNLVRFNMIFDSKKPFDDRDRLFHAKIMGVAKSLSLLSSSDGDEDAEGEGQELVPRMD